MSDSIPKPNPTRTTGLSPKEQKLQALRAKAAAASAKASGKPALNATASNFKAKDSFANTKKTNFQRKAT